MRAAGRPEVAATRAELAARRVAPVGKLRAGKEASQEPAAALVVLVNQAERGQADRTREPVDCRESPARNPNIVAVA
jgi:hypothetical protein